MSDMVERVARAICEYLKRDTKTADGLLDSHPIWMSLSGEHTLDLDEIARAAIAAMREPTIQPVWHVVCSRDAEDGQDPDECIWTVSRDPKMDGWNTDSGCFGYGLTKADAEELAAGANLVASLDKKP